MRAQTFSCHPVLRLAAVVVATMALSACATIDTDTAREVMYPSEVKPGNRIISEYRSWLGVNRKRRSQIHQGIDITGPPGQPVIAVADGLVVETHVDQCGGPGVLIDHGSDIGGKPLLALYWHVAEFLVEAGQTVSRGDPVARLGDNHREFKCIAGVRHLHLQLGRERRLIKKDYWGNMYFLKDGFNAVNPHLLWSDGPYRVTCFDKNKAYPRGTLTYPVPCGG